MSRDRIGPCEASDVGEPGGKLVIVGIGDDGMAGLTESARRVVQEADVILGAPATLRLLDGIGGPEGHARSRDARGAPAGPRGVDGPSGRSWSAAATRSFTGWLATSATGWARTSSRSSRTSAACNSPSLGSRKAGKTLI